MSMSPQEAMASYGNSYALNNEVFEAYQKGEIPMSHPDYSIAIHDPWMTKKYLSDAFQLFEESEPLRFGPFSQHFKMNITKNPWDGVEFYVRNREETDMVGALWEVHQKQRNMDMITAYCAPSYRRVKGLDGFPRRTMKVLKAKMALEIQKEGLKPKTITTYIKNPQTIIDTLHKILIEKEAFYEAFIKSHTMFLINEAAAFLGADRIEKIEISSDENDLWSLWEEVHQGYYSEEERNMYCHSEKAKEILQQCDLDLFDPSLTFPLYKIRCQLHYPEADVATTRGLVAFHEFINEKYTQHFPDGKYIYLNCEQAKIYKAAAEAYLKKDPKLKLSIEDDDDYIESRCNYMYGCIVWKAYPEQHELDLSCAFRHNIPKMSQFGDMSLPTVKVLKACIAQDLIERGFRPKRLTAVIENRRTYIDIAYSIICKGKNLMDAILSSHSNHLIQEAAELFEARSMQLVDVSSKKEDPLLLDPYGEEEFSEESNKKMDEIYSQTGINLLDKYKIQFPILYLKYELDY